MARIRGDNLGPESRLEEALADCGLHVVRNPKDLPGKPDFLVSLFKGSGDVLCVFVHGCFWHACFRHCRVPKTRTEWWFRKLDGNARRDKSVVRRLRKLGCGIMVVWEHSIKTPAAADKVAGRIVHKLRTWRIA